MEMELTAFKARFGLVKMKGKSYVDGQLVVEGDFQFAMVKWALTLENEAIAPGIRNISSIYSSNNETENIAGEIAYLVLE